MGLLIQAKCSCGFTQNVSVGGGMATYREKATFPFYCANCGLVGVNIAKGRTISPTCDSVEVT